MIWNSRKSITAQTTYTYNTSGQITSINGPRMDVADMVSLAYYLNKEFMKELGSKELGSGLINGCLFTETEKPNSQA